MSYLTKKPSKKRQQASDTKRKATEDSPAEQSPAQRQRSSVQPKTFIGRRSGTR